MEKVFGGLLYWFPDFREFIEAELGQTEPRGPHKPPGCTLPPRRTLVPRGPLLHLLALSRSFQGLLYPEKKIAKKFHGIWTSLGTDILKNQKQAKKQQLTLGTKLIG